MKTGIHPRAMVSPEAELAEDVEVGPNAIIEPGVVIGRGCRILANAYLFAGTTLGVENVVHVGAVLGGEPQDRGYGGAPTRVTIGDRNVFREGVTVNRGTAESPGTVIGSGCYLMANSHVAHDCRVGDDVVLANDALLGGHVSVGAGAFLGGGSMVHQHARVGRLAMVQGGCRLSRDLAPFVIGSALNVARGVNVVGLRRAGVSRPAIAAVRRLYREVLHRRRNLTLALDRFLAAEATRGATLPEVHEMLDFLRSSRRGVCVGRAAGDAAADV